MGDVRFVDNEGVRIAYEVDGASGPWLVLQHGLGYDRRDWGVVLEPLTAACRVLRLDTRGIGDSDAPTTPWTVGDMADDLRAVLDDAGIDRATIVGASLGGAVVQELTCRHPERVERLILMAPLIADRALYPGSAVSRTTDHALVDGREALSALLAGADPAEVIDPDQVRRNVAVALSPATVRERPELVDRIVAHRAAKPFPPAGWMGQDFAGSGYRYTAQLPDLDVAILVIQGTDDRVVNPAVADVLEERWPDAHVVRLDGRGHLPHWEDPDRMASLLTTWAVSGEVAS